MTSTQTPCWEVEVDRATPAEWSQMLDLFDDANIYQTHAYGEVRWGIGNLSHLVLKRGGEVVGIAQLRLIRPTKLNFGIAYLRWGPLFERRGRPVDPDVVAEMARALEKEYVERRRLFLQVLPNAFTGSARASAIETAFGRFHGEPAATPYRTFVLDIAPTREELRGALDRKWRNKLTRSEKNHLEISIASGCEQYEIFRKMYQQMQERKAFETTVDVEEFGRIQEKLTEPHRMWILICKERGTAVAGLVASAMGDTAIYLLGATGNDGLNSNGAYLLQWSLIQSLKEAGVRWYDLGGIDPERNPGVYTFKRGLSGKDICQIRPLSASRGGVSSAIVKAGLLMQRTLRRSGSFGRSLRQLATKN